MTADPDDAAVYAALATGGGGGDVYEVQPIGELEPDPADSRDSTAYAAPAAVVVAVVRFAVPLEEAVAGIWAFLVSEARAQAPYLRGDVARSARGSAAATADAGSKWAPADRRLLRNGDFRVRSRRGWDMTTLLPELADLPACGVFDGELVAFADGAPHFPLVCERLLHGDRSIPLTFVVFDVLELDGEPVIGMPYAERRGLLEDLALGSGPWFVAEAFADGATLFAAACAHGLEGVDAKRRLELLLRVDEDLGLTVGVLDEVTRRADHVNDDQPLWSAFPIELPRQPIADGKGRK